MYDERPLDPPRYHDLISLYREAVNERAWRTNSLLWQDLKRRLHGWSEETFQEIADFYDRKDRKAKTERLLRRAK